MRQLLEKVQKFNARFRLIRSGDGIVVGLSGGPDSTALLLVLSKLRKSYALRLYAAHLNHGLSPKQAVRFEFFCEKLTRRLNVPFFKKKSDVRVEAQKNKKTVEEMGRITRYEFFNQIAQKTGAWKIATAHTLDDQAETVAMRLARGAGLKGLSGIPVKRREHGRVVIRPFLGLSKKEVLAYLKKAGEPFCVDRSNRSDVYTRNRVRNHLLPWLEKNLNPQIKESLSDLAGICGDAQSFLEKRSEQAFKRCLLRKSSGVLTLDVARLQRLDPAILSEVIFIGLTHVKKERLRFGVRHLDGIRAILRSDENGLETHLPGGVIARRSGRALRIFDTPAK